MKAAASADTPHGDTTCRLRHQLGGGGEVTMTEAPPTAKEQPKPSFQNLLAPEGRGYYAALGLEFGCTQNGAQLARGHV